MFYVFDPSQPFPSSYGSPVTKKDNCIKYRINKIRLSEFFIFEALLRVLRVQLSALSVVSFTSSVLNTVKIPPTISGETHNKMLIDC